jgi:hypothetical protein
MTNGKPGHVGDAPIIPVVALKLVPKMAQPQTEDTWVVESTDDANIAAMLVLSDDRARELAHKILDALGQHEQEEQA